MAKHRPITKMAVFPGLSIAGEANGLREAAIGVSWSGESVVVASDKS